MALPSAFPNDPYAILSPDVRWYPGDAMLDEMGYENLLPPLVHKIRKGVIAWRNSGYAGASETTKALLKYWFETEHMIPKADGTMFQFRYYFCQREAVESIIWLYEIEQSRDPYSLMKYDSSGHISQGMFDEDWTRYVVKMATGAGKTKIMSLLVAWAYFHKKYEDGSDLSTNFLLVAPNIIVLDRLYADFQGLKIFYQDPVLPENGYEGQDWRNDFQVTLHLQDDIGVISDTGNIFLTNIHRVFENDNAPSFEDENTMDYFLGKRPTGKTSDSKTDLGKIIREVPDLVVINDEAHHVHDKNLAWFKSIEDISNQLRLKGSKLSAQFDLSATPKHTSGAMFVQIVSDYPLVEAIRQGIVKTPVLPDVASRAKLQERKSDQYTERYRDYLHLGYLEWKKVKKELAATGKKPILFIMTDDTKACDEVGEYFEKSYQELAGKILVIHTKANGEISEATGKSADELEKLRKASRLIDDPTSPYDVIVSVMMLREGWDVQNVVSIVGLRPYKAKSKILPEQTLGRGLRRMFRGAPVQEKVSVVGTEAFIEFVESIKSEGVDLEYAEMGEKTKPKSPMVVEVEKENPKKDLEEMDIKLPVLTPRIYREYKNLNELDVSQIKTPRLKVQQYTEEQQREIVFKDIDSDKVSHTTVLDMSLESSPQAVIGYFCQLIKRDLRLVGGLDILFGKLKDYITEYLFEEPVDISDLNTLRNLSDEAATKAIIENFKSAVNALTVRDKGTTEVRDHIQFRKTRPFLVNDQAYIIPKKSIFNKVVGDSHFELEFAAFLDGCSDITSFVKNSQSTYFKVEYRNADGSVANYYPDFIVKESEKNIWIIETKGNADLDVPLKWERLVSWCEDASAQTNLSIKPLYVLQNEWDKYRPKSFVQLCSTFDKEPEFPAQMELID